MKTELTKIFESRVKHFQSRIEKYEKLMQISESLNVDHLNTITNLVNSNTSNSWKMAKLMLQGIHPELWVDLIMNTEMKDNTGFRLFCGIQINPFDENDYALYNLSDIDPLTN